MKIHIMYVDGVFWNHHIASEGGDKHSIPMYNTIEDLKRESTCWQECGIVKVEIVEKEWVEP